MQRLLVSGCGLLCLVLCAMVLVWGSNDENQSTPKIEPGLFTPPSSQGKPSRNIDSLHPDMQSRHKVRQALQKTITVNLKNQKLGQVVALLSKESGVNFHLDTDELSDLNIDYSQPVRDMEFPDVSIEIAIGRILNPLEMGWYIEDDLVILTYIDRAKEALYTVAYDVEPLLTDSSNNGLAGYLPVAFSQANPGQLPSLDSSDIYDLLQNQSAGPWQQLDQEGGVIDWYSPNLVVVKQTRRVHDEIDELLKIMKEGVAGKLNYGSRINRHNLYPYEKDRKITRALNQKVDLNFKDNTVGDLVDYLKKTYELDVFLDSEELSDLNITRDASIKNFKMNGIKLSLALKLILEPMEIEALVEKGAVQITSIDFAKETLFNVVYDVRDLKLQDSLRNYAAQTNDVLMNETTGPWQDIDQQGGTMDDLKGILVIRQTAKMHAELEILLTELRKKRKPAAVKKKIDPMKILTEVYTVDANDDPEKVKLAIEMVIDDIAWNIDNSKNRLLIVSQKLVIRAPHELQQRVEKFLEKLQVPKGNDANPSTNRGVGFGGPGGGMSSIAPAEPVVLKRSSNRNLKLPLRR